MALFNFEALQQKLETQKSYDYLREHREFLNPEEIQINEADEFDIFLSHSYADREIIPQLKDVIENMGYSVYVDWINDKLLSRDNVSKSTAEVLQKRMQQSKSLFFATSENSPSSKWMPWELGYFDGIKDKRVAILPIKKRENDFDENFKGQEYLGLYYYVTIDTGEKYIGSKLWAMEKTALNELRRKMKEIQTLYIHESRDSFSHYDDWVKGDKPMSNEKRIVSEFEQILQEVDKK